MFWDIITHQHGLVRRAAWRGGVKLLWFPTKKRELEFIVYEMFESEDIGMGGNETR